MFRTAFYTVIFISTATLFVIASELLSEEQSEGMLLMLAWGVFAVGLSASWLKFEVPRKTTIYAPYIIRDFGKHTVLGLTTDYRKAMQMVEKRVGTSFDMVWRSDAMLYVNRHQESGDLAFGGIKTINGDTDV